MDLLDLVAKLRLDKSEYEKGLKGAEEDASGLGSKIASGLGTAAKVTASAIAAGSGAIIALTKSATDAYANYEQLEGGVKKLFGDASDEMMQYASNAYRTSGMSANQYMEQATSFSAALINSYEGDASKAAAQADKAMQAISDNFNTFGGDIQNVQNAFQGFAKQNYTMLDNLKLGYGGTKTEMQRLIDDANEYASSIGEASDLSIENFGDIVEAIDLIQRKQGIWGTTTKEATKTVEGSLNMLKASWENLITGFANPDADLDALFDNMVESAGYAFDNLMPVIERSLTSIGKAVERIVPYISEMLPALADDMLPPLLSAATTLVAGLADALPSIVSVLAGVAPDIINTLITALLDNLPTVLLAGLDIIVAIANGITESLPELIPRVVEVIVQIVTTLAENAPMLVEAALTLMIALGSGLIKAIPTLIRNVPKIVSAIVTALKGGVSKLISVGGDLVKGIWDGFVGKLDWIKDKIKGWVGNVTDFLKSLFKIGSPSKLLRDEIGRWLPEGIAVGVEANADSVYDQMDEMRAKVAQPFDVSVTGTTGISGSVEGYGRANYSPIIDAISSLASKVDNMQVILSTGEIVGALTPRIDIALGQTQALRARGI